MIELKYERCGDVLLPGMGLSDEDKMPVGKYGMMRCRYLEEHRSGLYTRLLLGGKLMRELHEVDRAAQRMMDEILPKMAKDAGLTERMKDTDPLGWAGTMNTLAAQVEEIICEELVYG